MSTLWGTQWARKISWGPFRIYQLISTANPAQFHSNRAGLAVLISWQILNGPNDFFLSFIFYILFILLNIKPLSIKCPHFSCIINSSQAVCKYFEGDRYLLMIRIAELASFFSTYYEGLLVLKGGIGRKQNFLERKRKKGIAFTYIHAHSTKI